MPSDLTSSSIDRQNVLNNRYALEKIEEHLALGGLEFEGDRLFTKQQLTELFDVSDSTIEKYLSTHGDELKANGYQLLKGKKLRDFKGLSYGPVTDYGTKTSVLGVFNFRAVLNIAMILTESERAKAVRSRILDIVIDVVAERAGGHTKFINQRDADYLPSAYREYSYRKVFTDALDQYLDMGKFKYGIYTNKVYQLVFKENAKEYKQILKLAKGDNVRDTFYSEVLKAIASIENGLSQDMATKAGELGRKLSPSELDALLEGLEENPYLKPVIDDARTKMASRDMSFRDALHIKLESYLQTVPEGDVDKFLGDASRSLEEQLSDPETLEVFKRLKDR
ncbi:DNA-binding protein [Dasania sp. GY-MA-18]|uniref:DNA-binding protein n=1 Tax=Dasania phycosphaerae TaxID=2950436 RepID=A0A9J6RN91_9GAMM|nr:MULTISPECIES: DNA-binding protein [Dasania]MCR8923191.1 DNA-binding protein [Dasania sp. GY-MA-18]MCZ0865623.1 DNA-binding protein [Dasania phycosphaerae]MCZ0869348.1 DNA-binding protein [Dasania phycosphaerae]